MQSRLIVVLVAILSLISNMAAGQSADVVYRNGRILSMDARNRTHQALAIRDGRIVYAGTDSGAARFTGKMTTFVDLQGRTVMPGIVDAHTHPGDAGLLLLECNLNYEALTISAMQKKIQGCLDATKDREPDGWLKVVSWFQPAMIPAGVSTSRATLDALNTRRPVVVYSTYGHTVLANSRALALAKFTRETKDPTGGVIVRDAAGEPTGLLEDRAFAVFEELLPRRSSEDYIRAAEAALQQFAMQGVTTFLEALPSSEQYEAYASLQRKGGLTARAHFAPVITPDEGKDVPGAISSVLQVRSKYDQGPIRPAPTLTVRNAKMFLDGVDTAPSFTGALLQPYFVNAGTASVPKWVEGTSRGPDVYFPANILSRLLTGLGRAGIDPHMHADGDRAVREGLDATEAMRKALTGVDVRVAMAHNEIVSPQDYSRYAKLGVNPVLSFQWENPATDVGESFLPYLGPDRARIAEPAGFLAQRGATIAFGSDWPVDVLNEWLAFQVGVTRMATPDDPPAYKRGRLGTDPGLTPLQVMRAATINGAVSLHEETNIGSLETGKLADLIVLDRNPLTIAPSEISAVKVLRTVVGGRVVYDRMR